MTLRGRMNRVSGDFTRSVRNASMKGIMDAQGGIYGTRKIVGYVCDVHKMDDESDELAGTVDVQEYDYEPGEDKYEGAGHHKGVFCTALQNNKTGFYVMPSMYSDVIIVQDPVTFQEYVLMCSHIDVIQLQSHQSVRVGVVETEEFKEAQNDDDDIQDVDELEETGNAALSEYTKDSIIHTVKTKDGNVVVTHKADGIEIKANDTTITVNADGSVSMSAANVEIKGTSSLKTTSPTTTIDGKTVEVTGSSFVRKGTANTDGMGGFCGIPVCPFTGAPHTGSTITG